LSVPRSNNSRYATIAPFRYSRPVRFGDTDAAGIVYTGRVPDMALEALEIWFRDRLALNWFENLQNGRVDVPAFISSSTSARR
jgi:acyl-CoA thioesterase FadM